VLKSVLRDCRSAIFPLADLMLNKSIVKELFHWGLRLFHTLMTVLVQCVGCRVFVEKLLKFPFANATLTELYEVR